MNDRLLEKYKEELLEELHSILQWWTTHMMDSSNGFKGEIDAQGQTVSTASKGLVMYSRILWTFSAAYRFLHKEEYLAMAKRAYKGLLQEFADTTYGGFYWSIDYLGAPLDKRKQLYGQAFALYGLAEYAAATGDNEALTHAIQIFQWIEEKGKDPVNGGYWEARAQDGSFLEDSRLSEKDPNVAKSMNTHLHVVEAYTRLVQLWPNQTLLNCINELLSIFKNYIIDPVSSRQQLYFLDDWTAVGSFESYGHDIEASWLLYEAASLHGLEKRKEEFGKIALQMAEAASVAIDKDGGLFYEKELTRDHLSREKHWWPQAEAMVGFFNAWEIGGGDKNLQRSLQVWNFVKHKILDKNKGEWFWGIDENGQPMPCPKAGFWKCPYHNGRACLEIIKRVQENNQ